MDEEQKLIKRILYTNIKEVNEEEFTIRAVFSTDDEDRHEEVVVQNGWDLSKFKMNPVVLFAHDHWQPAIGKVIEIGLNAQGQLEGVIKFAVEEYDFAKTIFNLYKGNFMRAFSAGFINKKYEYDQETDKVKLLENELLEMSTVNVPANAFALAKSAGVDMTPLKKAMNKGMEEDKLKEVTKTIMESVSVEIKKTVDEKVAEIKSTDKPIEKKEVETPKGKGGKKSRFTNKKLNKAVRDLLKQKKNIKS